ncbi:MAG: hypothetical protein R3A45_11585 [Bdellovibrionota bacterium]
MRTLVLCIALATTLFSVAFAETVEQALDHLQHQQYQQAQVISQQLLDSLQLNTIADISLAHKILGVSHCELQDEVSALNDFKTLKTFSPEASLDGLTISDRCQKLFTSMTLTPSAKSRRQGLSSKKPNASGGITPAQELHQQAQTPQPQVPSNRYIPFGVGQFQNKQRKKGLGFLIAQSLLYTAGATTMIAFNDSTTGDIGLSMMLAGGFVSVWGILDARQTYRKNYTISE